MDDLTPTVYPQHITRLTKTQEALPYRNNPYRNNPYEIAPPPPLPNTPVIIERKRGKGRWVAKIIVLFLLVGAGLVSIYAASNYWYDQGYSNGHADGIASKPAQNDRYQAGYTDGQRVGYNAGKSEGYTDGKNTGYNSGYTDGQNSELLSIYDFLVKGNTDSGKPCIKTSDQPDYYYFQMQKDGSGAITYYCLTN